MLILDSEDFGSGWFDDLCDQYGRETAMIAESIQYALKDLGVEIKWEETGKIMWEIDRLTGGRLKHLFQPDFYDEDRALLYKDFL